MNRSIGPTIPLVLTALAIFFVLEKWFPLRKQTRPLAPRLLVNVVLSGATYLAAAFIMRPATIASMHWGEGISFGLLHWVSLPNSLNFIIGFLLLDLSFYYWHRLNHALPFLWRFHNVHHFDPDMDVSTGFRFHFVEILLSTFFRVSQALLIGASFETFFVFELVFQVATYFHHSNFRLPLALDRCLNFVIVTPRMHAIHHSQYRNETDSNYSVIFSLWDKMNRSFLSGIPMEEILIGVPGYSSEKDNRLGATILSPFISQHDYWNQSLTRRREGNIK